MSKYGFSNSINNVEALDAIFDLLQNKYEIVQLNRRYLVWEDDAITDKIIELQRQLSKPFYSYVSNQLHLSKHTKGISKSEYQKVKQQYDEEQLRLQKEIKRRQKKKEERENVDRGIYGIYCNENLIYIGKTEVSFQERFKQHQSNLELGEQYLYKYIRECKANGHKIMMCPLINIKELDIDRQLTSNDIKSMELALIKVFQPCCNIEGRLSQYHYNKYN